MHLEIPGKTEMCRRLKKLEVENLLTLSINVVANII
jgi:hypothetical protein